MPESLALIEVPIPILTRRLPRPCPYPDAEAVRLAAEAFWSTPGARRLLPTASAHADYQAQRAFEFTYWSYPALKEQRLPLVVAINEFAYATDFVFDDIDGGEASSGQTCGRDLAGYVDVFSDLAAQAQVLLSPRQYERLVAAVAEAFEHIASQRDAAVREETSGEIYHRHLNSGWIWVAELILELAIGVDLSAYLTSDSLLRQYYHAGCSAGVLVNDIFSLRKEYYSSAGLFNVVPALARERGISFADAVTVVAEWVLREEYRCYELRERLLASPAGSDPSVRAFITAFEYWLAGNLHWSRLTPRYHGKGFEYDGTTEGTMVLHPDRTIYAPAGSGESSVEAPQTP
ncbi:hypothetical protein ACFVXQ_22300 [Kitasatospora sp. NPDC058263]